MSDEKRPEVAQKAPYVMDMEAGTYFWCSCGRSSGQPFCDGSHAGSSFRPVKEVLAAPAKVAWCGCKHSGKVVRCDGSHGRL